MRIISGNFRGRKIFAPGVRSTRPMTEKVRGALFDILGPINDFNVLDAYAGSGALGFEAISRGAKRVIAIESGKRANINIKKTIDGLGVDFQYQLVPNTVESWLARSPKETFDLIFFMPPYAIFDGELAQGAADLLNPDGLMVIEYSRQQNPASIDSLDLVDTRDYGDQKLAFYRKQT